MGNSSTYYLISVGMDSKYNYLNKRYAAIFEPLHGNLVGKHFATTMHRDDQQICESVSGKALMHRELTFPATLRKHDGKGGYIITKWEYMAMHDENDLPLGVFCIGHDITELIQNNEKLQEIKFSHSHSIRRYVANLLGLAKLVQGATEVSEIQDAAKMIVQSATDLDKVVREVNN